jgi:hypothetical protein
MAEDIKLGYLDKAATSPPDENGMFSVHYCLSEKPSSVWIEAFLECWKTSDSKHTYGGITHVVSDRIMLVNVTTAEIKDHYHARLAASVDFANKETFGPERRQVEEKRLAHERLEKHQQEVDDAIRDIE